MKSVFILALFAVAFPCFAEVRVARAGVKSRDYTVGVNVAYYWNDKYTNPKYDMNEFANKKVNEILNIFLSIGVTYQANSNCYLVGQERTMWTITLLTTVNNSAACGVTKENVDNGYSETVYQQLFNSYNDAKRVFDQYCDKYYNIVAK